MKPVVWKKLSPSKIAGTIGNIKIYLYNDDLENESWSYDITNKLSGKYLTNQFMTTRFDNLELAKKMTIDKAKKMWPEEFVTDMSVQDTKRMPKSKLREVIQKIVKETNTFNSLMDDVDSNVESAIKSIRHLQSLLLNPHDRLNDIENNLEKAMRNIKFLKNI